MRFEFALSWEDGRHATCCHSERSEESPHLKAQSVWKNAGMLLPQGGISMTDPKVVSDRN